MLNAISDFAEAKFSSLMTALKFHINDYCDLETTSQGALVAKDGSMATILRYNGFRSLVGKNEYGEFTDDFSRVMAQFYSSRGHQMQVVYYRDDDASDEVDRFLQPSYDTAKKLQLDIGDILDEKKAIANKFCMDEQVFVVLWTRPAVLDPVEVKISKKERDELARNYRLPSMKNAQNMMRPISFMNDRHKAYVEKVVNDIRALKGSVEVLDAHAAFTSSKRTIYKNTPRTWRPRLPGDPIPYRWKNNNNARDISEVMYPRLDDQFFTAPAINGNKKGIGGVTNMQAVRIGSRIFAPVIMKLAPRRDPSPSFTSLFSMLNNSGSKNRDGVDKQIPWSISFLIEGDGLKGVSLRKIAAGILALTSKTNRDLVKAFNYLSQEKANGDGHNAKLQISAMTWVDAGTPNADDILMIRRSKLSGAMQGWGDAVVDEETGDPTAGVMSCVPAISLTSIAPAAAAPLEEIARLLPLSRPASPFHRGTTVFRTLDGKLMPYEIFSDEQATWITLLFGGPGSGKSVLANRLNEEMCLMGGLSRLPFICVIDIGISSSGFISLIKDSLPEHMKHLAVYTRIQNTAQYAVNQFDLTLGQRAPMPREREAMKNFLVRLATPPEREKPHNYMSVFVSQVIDNAFRKLSDKAENGQPAKYISNMNSMIRETVEKHNIEITHEVTTWWEVVDGLFAKGLFYEASVAQRYAVPTLYHMLQEGTDKKLIESYSEAKDEGMQVAEEFRLMIMSAMGDYPVFSGFTQFDVGESRIMALDLQDVVATGSAAAKKQASLMYMVALNAFMRKISIIAEDLPLIDPMYRKYHAKRVEELAQDYKRLFCDEYHKTGGDENLQESFLIYGRESRKWLLEIVLGSQLPQDFKELAQIATSIFILDAGNEVTRKTIKEVFGLSATEVTALKNYVHGPKPGEGATFLAKLKTTTGDLSQLFTATSGGLELWGLSTTGEDRALRNKLYARMPSNVARTVLKKRFPGGSCKSYVLKMKQKTKEETHDGFVDDDGDESIIDRLASELIANWENEQEHEVAIA